MFNTKRTLSEVAQTSWEDEWFQAPFLRAERCKELDDWSKGKHSSGNAPEKLSDATLKENAELFLKDYEAMILAYCQAKWRRTALGSDTSIAEVLGANFNFQPDKWSSDSESKGESSKSNKPGSQSPAEKSNAIYYNQYMTALLYFSSEILSETLKKRAVRMKQVIVAEDKRPTWADLRQLIMRYMKAMDSRFIMREIICAKREDEETLLDWVLSFTSHRQLLLKSGVDLPDILWIDWIWAQTSPIERRIVSRPKSVSEFEKKVSSFVLEDLPVYRSSLCAQEVRRLPVIPTTKEKRPKGRQEKPKPTEKTGNKNTPSSKPSKYCGYCKTRNADHIFEECPKLLRRKAKESKGKASGKEKPDPKELKKEKTHATPPARPTREAAVKGERRRRGLCLVCGEAGHFANDCPQKAKGFIGVIQAELFPIGSLGILKAKANFLVGGKVRRGIVALDTCCSTTIVSRFVSNPVDSQDLAKASRPTTARVCGGETVLGPLVKFNLAGVDEDSLGTFQGHLGHNGTNGLLPVGCVALFSRELLHCLNVDLNWHQDQCVSPAAEIPWLKLRSSEEIFLSEAKVREFLSRKDKESKVEVKAPLDAICFCSNLSPGTRARLERIVRRFQHLFVDDNSLPPPIRCQPHEFQLKPGAKPFHCPEPRWTPAKAELIDEYVDEGLRSGLLERAPLSPWANRVHDALKPGSSQDDWGIRLCVDAVQTNERIEKIAPEVPNLKSLVLTFSDKTLFWETDAPKAYNLIPLGEKSRNLTTIWSRKHGKVRFTRLIWGFINAGTILQSELKVILAALPQEIRQSVLNYMDDLLGGCVSEEELCTSWEAFLVVADKHNLSLKASKTKLGYPTATFGGYEIGHGQRSLALKHLAPLLKMAPPTDVSSLRHTLGVFVQSKDMIPNYSILVKPLTRLTGKVPWRWADEEQKTFDLIKEAISKNPKLHNPDWKRRLHLNVDASDLGWGAVLYQLKNEQPEDEVCTDPKPDQMQVILYISEAFDRAMLARPTYYKEGYALIKGIGKVRFYIEHSPFISAIHTDHFPQKWMKHSQRGLIVGWRVAELAGLTYEIFYLPGPKNKLADSMSRFPLITRTQLAVEGLDAIFGRLLKNLPDASRALDNVWVWAERDTPAMARVVQHWRTKRNPILKMSPKETSYADVWDIALLAPSAERAPIVCAKLFKINRPFACLVTNDLVDWIPTALEDKLDMDLQHQVREAQKITFLSPGFTWIVNIPLQERMPHQIYPVEKPKATLGTREDWISDTQTQRSALLKQSPACVMGPEGLVLHVVEGQPVRTVVPFGRRTPLTMFTHIQMSHRGWRKVLKALRNSYFWKNMSRDVKLFLLECTDCIEIKGRLALAHGLFSAREYDAPRVFWAIDYLVVSPSSPSEDGFRYILTAMDLFTHGMVLVPTKTREAEEAVLAVLHKIIFRFGVMSVIVSDEEKAFNGRLLSGLEKALAIKHISTAPYDARGNAQLEASHEYLGDCLRLLDDEDRKVWNRFTPQWEFAYSTVTHSTIGFTPFELTHGTRARTVADAVTLARPAGTNVSAKRAEGLYAKILESAKLIHEVAKKNARLAREDELARLNSSGFKREFKVGDLVAFYIPSRANTEDWRLKFSRVYTGPAIVVRKEGKVFYEIKEISSGKLFVRTVTFLKPWTAPASSPTQPVAEDGVSLPDAVPQDFEVGVTLAVFDEDDRDCFWLADVVECRGDNSALVHFRGTRTARIGTASFRLVWIESKTGLSILAERVTRRLLSPGCTASAWTGVVDRSDILLYGVQLTKAKRVSAKSRLALSAHLHKVLQ